MACTNCDLVQLLKPGPAVDALVASTVFNWKWDKNRCPVCGWEYAKDREGGCRPGDCSMRPAPKKMASEVPAYSTTWQGAGMVLEEMARRAKCIRIETRSDGTMEVSNRDPEGFLMVGWRGEKHWDHGEMIGFNFFCEPEHVPLAIARAAVIATCKECAK